MTRRSGAGNATQREALPPTLFRMTMSTRVLLVLAVLAFAAVAVWAMTHGQPAVAVAALGPIFAVGIGIVVARVLSSGAFVRAEDDVTDPSTDARK